MICLLNVSLTAFPHLPLTHPLQAHLMFINHLKHITSSRSLDSLFPDLETSPPIPVEGLVLHSIQVLIIFSPLTTIYKRVALSFLFPSFGLCFFIALIFSWHKVIIYVFFIHNLRYECVTISILFSVANYENIGGGGKHIFYSHMQTFKSI